jgi:uncharacterized repeat protein (TIGR02543 family)
MWGRTVMPTVGLEYVDSWELLGAKQGGSQASLLVFPALNENATIALEPGTWSFTLKGVRAGVLALSGSIEDKTISLEGENILVFEVEPVKNEGSGDISITINLPTDSGVTSVEVFKDGVELIPSGVELTLSITPVGDTIVFTKTFPVEEYRFSFRLLNQASELLSVVSEMVHVWADLTSAKTYTLLQKDLNLTYTISYLVYNKATQEGDKIMDDGHYQIAATTKLATPDPLPDYYFKGWYERPEDAAEDALSGSAVTQIPVGSTGNKAFYAKWIPKTLSGYSLADALDLIGASPEADEKYTIILTKDADAAPTELSYGGKKVSITLEGGTEEGDTEERTTLKLDSTNGSLFTLGSGVTLSLDDNITLEGRKDNTASLVAVNSGAELVMNDGSKISGNTGAGGGGVMVNKGGKFTMTGGEISGNTASSYGGGIFVWGTFNMSGGKISGNTANNESEGGGVHINTGIFTMSGGEVSGNTAKSGGGVFVSENGTFTMSKGKVSGNIATSIGGGVLVFKSSSRFTMSGEAIISDNTATNYGGGVYVTAGVFTMNNGVISHNTAKRGGGVYRAGGTFTKASGGAGVIYGSEADTTLKNTATDGDAYGHAVYVSTDMKRNITVEAGKPLKSAEPGAAGGWIDPIPGTLSLTDSLTWLSTNAMEGGAYTITLTGDATIAPTTLSYSGKAVSITLAGEGAERTLSLSSSGSLFTVEDGVTLKLGVNITLQGRNDNTTSLVKVNSGAALEMNADSKIRGNTSSNNGGGVFVDGGAFFMNSGAISGNNAPSGGGVFVESGTFTKASGGVIYGSDADSTLQNAATDGDTYGHAVYVSTAMKRDSTAAEGVTLDSTQSDSAGWE